MSSIVAEHGASGLSLRHVAVLTFDAIATLVGLYTATVAHVPRDWAPSLTGVALLLVTLRVATLCAARLHRWPFGSAGLADGARLAGAMLVASVVFALACRGLPLQLYALELVLTTGLMAALRFGLPVLERWYADTVLDGPRRTLNIVVALLALVVSFPLWIVIAVAIKLTSRGPVIYKQERVGIDIRRSGSAMTSDPRRKRDLGGRPFMMYKFRTMTVDAERATGAVWSKQDDPRVTPIGRFLRHCRLDELPQLVNVLRGDMNIVGPRPERPTIFAELRTKIPNYQIRQRVRPGITGYAQVNLEYDASVDDVTAKLKYDLDYLSQQSIAADLAIMAKTVPVMLFRDWVLRRSDAPKRC
jgi:lipopolysaccharide/colanic/teichoic acid biosynthesis glycosyltransferase